MRGASLREDVAAIGRFNASLAPRIAVVGVEATATTVADVIRVSQSVDPRIRTIHRTADRDDTDALLDAIRDVGCYAKLRTGGVTPDRFRSARDVARVLSGCQARRVPLKATAGLHHPVRSVFSVTGHQDAPRALMHGFVNVLFAAVLCAAGSRHQDQLERVLDERNPRAFAMESDGIRWRDAVVSNADCADARAQLLRSVGSCLVRGAYRRPARPGMVAQRSTSLTTPNFQLTTSISQRSIPNIQRQIAQAPTRWAPVPAALARCRNGAVVPPQEGMQASARVWRDVQECRHLPRLTARLVHRTPEQRPDVVPPQVVCLKGLIHGRPKSSPARNRRQACSAASTGSGCALACRCGLRARRDRHRTPTMLRSIGIA